MNMTETSKLLTLAAMIDNRAVSPELVAVWQGLLHDIDYLDAEQALKDHYRSTRQWLMPSDIRDHVEAAQKEARRAPNRELAAQRQWLLDHGIDWIKYEAGDEYTVETVKALVRGDDDAPAALKEIGR